MSDKLRAVLVGDTLTYNLTTEQAIAVGINPAVYVGAPGKSPYIGEDGYWYEYDNDTQEWKKTDTKAQGPQGNVGPVGPQGPKGTTAWADLTGKPEFADVAMSGSYNDLTNKPELAEVATSGDYADLSGTKNVATKDYVGEQIDGIQLGGRNLLLDTNAPSLTAVAGPANRYFSSGGETAFVSEYVAIGDPPTGGIRYGARIRVATAKSGHSQMLCWYTNGVNVPMVDGETYTASCYARVTAGNPGLMFQYGVTKYSFAVVDVAGSAWKRYSWTFVYKDAECGATGGARIYMGSRCNADTKVDSTLECCGFKLELGSKATDWSPSPDDVYQYADDAVKAGVDGIQIGGTNLITLEDIKNPPRLYGCKIEDFNGSVKLAFDSNLNQPMDWNTRNLLNNPKFIFGETYTISFIAKSSSKTRTIFSDFWSYNENVSIASRMDFVISSDPKRYSAVCKLEDPGVDLTQICFRFWSVNRNDQYGVGPFEIWDIKLEHGNKPTSWSPAPEDTDYRRAGVTYDYGGRNLKEVFGTPEALHSALAAEDYTNIAVGDYWPITLNGTFYDYGSYTVQSGKKYYSNNTLQTQAGTTSSTYGGNYVSDTAVSFSLSGATYYVATSDCLPYYARTCNNTEIKLEIAGINTYWKYGTNNEDIQNGKPHLLMISRDCFPFYLLMRKGENKWEDESAQTPWLGSALYKTLNDSEHGVIKLLSQTELGPFIYSGAKGNGMSAVQVIKPKDVTNPTAWNFFARGKLFLPSNTEVWGHPFFADMNWDGGLSNQINIFRDSRRHIIKGFGDKGSPTRWWEISPSADSTTNFGYVGNNGAPNNGRANQGSIAAPICFLFM